MALGLKGKEISLVEFKRNLGELIAADDTAYIKSSSRDIVNNRNLERDYYSEEDVKRILASGSTQEKKNLSSYFFKHNSMYKKIILHYASFLTYQYLLVPHTPIEDGFSDPNIMLSYDDAVDFLYAFDVENKCSYFTYKILVEGAYYGLIKEVNKKPVLMDLPIEYCRSRFKSDDDIDVVEFDLSFFDSIRDPELKKQVLVTYPKYIQKEYKKYLKNKQKYRWMFLNPSDGVHFNFYAEYPFFLDIIPLLQGYDELSEINKTKRNQEIQKILINEMPITSQGELVFEPVEALEMHQGYKRMLKGNIDVTPLTTYTKTHIESLQDTSSAENNYLEQARTEIFGVTGTSDQIVTPLTTFAKAHVESLQDTSAAEQNYLEQAREEIFGVTGTSTQVFAPNTAGAIPYYLQNTLSLMRAFSRQYQQFFTILINRYYSTKEIRFNIIVPPISNYNTKEFIADAFKLASSGYSFFMPCLALGVGQRDLRDLKLLEGTLRLRDILEPLHSSYTESSKSQSEEQNETAAETKENSNVDNTGGAPTKDNPSEKTIQNRESL